MVRINSQQRNFLEKIGVLKPIGGNYNEQMSITCKGGKSKKKNHYVNDYFLIYINPELYKEKMKKYLSEKFIEQQIKQGREYINKIKI